MFLAYAYTVFQSAFNVAIFQNEEIILAQTHDQIYTVGPLTFVRCFAFNSSSRVLSAPVVFDGMNR